MAFKVTYFFADVLEKPPSSISDTRSFQLAQKFYHSCTHPTDDEVGVAEMRLLIDEMTANLDNGVDPMSYLAKILPNIRSSLNGNFIVSLEVDVDDKNTEENAIYVSDCMKSDNLCNVTDSHVSCFNID